MRNLFKFSVPESKDLLTPLKYFMGNLRGMNFLKKILSGVRVCKFAITVLPADSIFHPFQIELGEIFDFTSFFSIFY